MSEFQALLDDLDALRKSHGAADIDNDDDLILKAAKPASDDDDDIKDAADGDADDDGIDDGDEDIYDHDEPDGDEDGEGDDGDGDEPMGKSFRVTLDDGNEMEAYDGTALLESLREDTQQEFGQAARVMSRQNDLIKALSREVRTLNRRVEAMAARPAGRKSVLNVHDKPSALPDQPAKPVPGEVLAKALQAQRAGKLHGGQIAEIEAYLAHGADLPAHLSRWMD